MKIKIVLAGLMVTVIALEVSAQRAEYDDMYFRASDREKNKAIEAENTYASARHKKQKNDYITEEDTNPTDSYSARNINPEYVSRSNSEKASEDERDYYLEGYSPKTNFNNSYYNNANWARNSYYANSMWNSPYYGYCRYCDPWTSMGPYYGGYGYYDPWIMPSFGFGPSYGWRTGLLISLSYGNYWNPYGGFGYGYPYYGYGYGYPVYYERSNVNFGKRPSRHSAVVNPTERTVTRSRTNTTLDNSSNINSRTRTRQSQDEYYVRPSRRTSWFDTPSNSSRSSDDFLSPSSQPSRRREYTNPSGERWSPSSTPSFPSRNSGGNSGGGGSSSPRPRGRS